MNKIIAEILKDNSFFSSGLLMKDPESIEAHIKDQAERGFTIRQFVETYIPPPGSRGHIVDLCEKLQLPEYTPLSKVLETK